jgi:hypothetical protein
MAFLEPPSIFEIEFAPWQINEPYVVEVEFLANSISRLSGKCIGYFCFTSIYGAPPDNRNQQNLAYEARMALAQGISNKYNWIWTNIYKASSQLFNLELYQNSPQSRGSCI